MKDDATVSGSLLHQEEHKEEIPTDPLEAELKKCDLDFEELLKLKINAKGSTLQDLKKRSDDQKSLILKLREG